ncbi:MAG TPA: ABC transporter permease [Polyangiales bacterium]|nr:ABC transporter permease [Polyangiales bacterium]
MTTIALQRPRLEARGVALAMKLLPLAALIVSLGAGVLLIASTGVPLARALEAFWDGIAASDYALVGSLLRAVPLALVGLGFMLAERANLTNVGGEGQICIGGLFSTATALYGGADHLPGPLAWLYPLVAGTIAGAVWGAIAGGLKARRGSNEVITTLLLTFIALPMVYGSVQTEALLRQPKTSASTLPESLEIPASTQLPQLISGSSLPLHIGVLIVLLASIAIWLVLKRSALGLRFLAVGQNSVASRRAGLPVNAIIIAALAASGALGGLAGAIMIQGDQHYLTAGFSSGFGEAGLVVGLLSRGSPIAALGFALLFGCLRSGGLAMEMSAAVPSAIVVVCQGLIVIATAAAAALSARRA